MPDQYLNLSSSDQKEILTTKSKDLGVAPDVLEKDVWICWVLKVLFEMKHRPTMAFKGGTSLSKAFNIIKRFSEDIDITLDYRELGESITGDETRSQLARISAKLKNAVKEFIEKEFSSYINDRIAKEFSSDKVSIELDPDGETVWLEYPSVLPLDLTNYVKPRVKIEFGGRNVTEPNDSYLITTYLSNELIELVFPQADVTVLSITRTFWEKATLIHAACNRSDLKASAERQSRHWYDLALLGRHNSGKQAMENIEQLRAVVDHKKAFFYSANSNYDDCLNGGLCLVPPVKLLTELHEDYKAMSKSGMFYETPPSFDIVVEELRSMQEIINNLVASDDVAN